MIRYTDASPTKHFPLPRTSNKPSSYYKNLSTVTPDRHKILALAFLKETSRYFQRLCDIAEEYKVDPAIYLSETLTDQARTLSLMSISHIKESRGETAKEENEELMHIAADITARSLPDFLSEDELNFFLQQAESYEENGELPDETLSMLAAILRVKYDMPLKDPKGETNDQKRT